ncbi:hypothetical protein CPB84DRAFT_1743775 [Gymnopilus junonius]|uniref:Uncharacterized protein n=1 Tax=Gymnopilus junonius TaxID=109634 RepID=A0A9P5P035_GYMJU|nr:hypothetical protein CPB84DRAFT_1743775 [Gymnopilus junonius]
MITGVTAVTAPAREKSDTTLNDSPEPPHMDEHRAQTLQALEAFIQTQRTLLARQQSDIERLQRLRVDLVQRPTEVLKNLSNELDDTAFRMSEQGDCRLKVPKEIEWSIFEKSDTGPLRTFAQAAKEDITQRSRPSPIQRSELSELQREDEMEIDPFELRRQQEQQKIRELKKRQIQLRGGGLSLPLSSRTGGMGVFVKHDAEEEAMAADVSIDGDDGRSSIIPVAADMDVDTPQATSSVGPTPLATVKPAVPDPEFAVYATTCLPPFAPPLSDTSTPRPRSRKVKLKLPVRKPALKDEEEGTSDPAEDDVFKPAVVATITKKRGTEKPKPETYKQAWTESEQNLLEQLLEEVPDGEKNRWQKISIAMGGRRTPRQVASRVQKYFEKLKKFGIGIGGAG